MEQRTFVKELFFVSFSEMFRNGAREMARDSHSQRAPACRLPDASGMALRHSPSERRNQMNWDTPEYSDIRFGFEVTMYINNK
jgi:coenzyme PQQ precursor peptide PqqA